MAKLFVDYFSQPSRACVLLCRLHSLPVEIVSLDIVKGEHKQPWITDINPLCQLPFYSEGAFSLVETFAILWYLCETHADVINEHWYPRDIKHRSQVSSVCHWYHSTLRAGCAGLIRKIILCKSRSSSHEDFVNFYLTIIRKSLQTMESFWLKETKFLCGDLPCVADIVCSCEIEQLNLLEGQVHGPRMKEFLGDFPMVRAWFGRVSNFCNPLYEEVHKPLRHATLKLKQRRLSGASKL